MIQFVTSYTQSGHATLAEAALAYANAGLPVFPCKPKSKKPACEHGYQDATLDPIQIAAWWTENPDYNIGACPEYGGFAVIDADGPEGCGNLLALDLPETLTVRTPHGGRHLWFRGSLPSTAGMLAPKIDTRGVGGYGILPPSRLPEGDYSFENRTDLAPLPEEIPARLARSRHKGEQREDAELDMPANVQRARTYLKTTAPVAVEGQRDAITNTVAWAVLSLGISAPLAVVLMRDLWAPRGIDLDEGQEIPPGYDDLIAWKVYHAAQKATNSNAAGEIPPGWHERAAAVGAGEPEAEEAEDIEWPDFETLDVIGARPEKIDPQLWHGRLLANMPFLLTGPDGVGKTTLLCNIAVASQAGVSLWGQQWKQTQVFMLVGEDRGHYIRRQLRAVARAMGVDPSIADQIRVCSTYDSNAKGDPLPAEKVRLVEIAADGAVTERPFMRWIASRLRSPSMLVIDPLDAYAVFDRYRDTPARALCAGWLIPLCHAGVTTLVSDHPSHASVTRGNMYAGSVQFRAPFPGHASLTAVEKEGLETFALTFHKIRQGRRHTVMLEREENSPVFVVAGASTKKPSSEEIAIYRHVFMRLDEGLPVHHNNRGGNHGPREIGLVVGIEEKTVKDHLDRLIIVRRWLAVSPKSTGLTLGEQAPHPIDLDSGF